MRIARGDWNFPQFIKPTKFFKIGNREAELLTVKVGAFLFSKIVEAEIYRFIIAGLAWKTLYTFFFYKQWVYKHTEPQITEFLSISLSIFPASDLPIGKVLLLDFVYFVTEIEPSYDFFLSFVSGLYKYQRNFLEMEIEGLCVFINIKKIKHMVKHISA